MNRNSFGGWFMCVAAAALGSAASAIAQPKGPMPAMVVLDAARQETVEQFRPVTGELQAVRRALLAAEEEGLVVEVVPEEGDLVKQGDVVARLRETRARLDVQRAEADLAARRAEVAEREGDLLRARQELERVEALQSAASAAWKELQDKRTAVIVGEARVQVAQADVAGAESALDWARERLARMTVVAPFTGRVIAKRTEIGQWLRQGDPVIEVLALDQLDARLDVPERFMARLTGFSEPIRVRLQASGETVQAPIAAIIPEADTRSRLFPIRVRLDNQEGKLRPGMSITGLIPSGSNEPALTIHKDGIRRDEAGEYVFFDAGGTAAVARIRPLFPVGNRVAIESGTLSPGAMVVIEGNERMFPGQPLIPAAPHGAAGGGPSAATQPAQPDDQPRQTSTTPQGR